MKEKIADSLSKRNELLVGVAFISVFTMFSSAFTGGIIAAFFGNAVGMLIGFQIQWWQGALLGGGIGLVVGVIRAIQEVRRSAGLEQFSGALGLKPLDDSDVSLVESDLRVMLSRDVDLSDGHFLSSMGAHIVVGDLRIESPRDQTLGNSGSQQQDTSQTCVCFRFDEFEFPSFELRPEGMMSRFLDGLMGGNDIDFEESPIFSRKFLLTGRHPKNVRILFSQRVRAHFEKHLGLRVVATKKQLLLFRPNTLCQPDELESFVGLAMESVDLLQTSAVNVKWSPETKPTRPSNKKEALKELEGKGIVGALVRRQIQTTMVDHKELDQFLNQPKPRMIPRELRKRFGFDPFLMIFVFLPILVGTVFAMTSVSGVEFDEPGEKLIFGILGSGLILLGGFLFWVCWFFRRRKMRVLRHGEVITGTIKSVEETAWVLGNERVFCAKFQPAGQDKLVLTYFRGCNIQHAKDLAESGQTTRLLYDAVKPDNSLLIECYSI